MKIAIIAAQFNEMIVDKMLAEAVDELTKKGLQEANIEVFHVPGAFEIPVVSQKIIDSKKFDGIIALGCVIRGETEHFDYVCRGVTDGIQKVSIENRFPIMFGVLTVNNVAQAMVRVKKGRECADGIIQMVELFKKL